MSEAKPSLKVLELFSGTGSIGKVCKELNWEVISLDFLSKWEPDIVADILEWDYKVYPPNTFDIVWGSPPCAEYSSVKNSWIGREVIDGKTKERYIYTREIQEEKMKQSDKLVLKVFEIIDYFKPKYWFMENPNTGRLKWREFMEDKPFFIVDYCKYCDWGYRKRTRIWTNKKDFEPKICKWDCCNLIEGQKKHKADVSKTYSTPEMRYRIPPQLIKDLFSNC
jgi:site-specific DNA-cytosine methylase